MFLGYLQICGGDKDKGKLPGTEKRKAEDGEPNKDLKKVRGISSRPHKVYMYYNLPAFYYNMEIELLAV